MILKSWPWERCYPKVICIEDGNKKIKSMLGNKGYILRQKTESNSIFMRGIEKTEI